MRLFQVLGLAVGALTLSGLVSAAEATDPRFSAGDRRVQRSDGRRPGDARHVHRHHHGPTVVFVNPSRCWQSGYWTYQWVPQSYAYTTWVPGQWLSDGRWIDGHYQPGLYASGYYQPLWVEGYWAGC